MIMLWKSGAGYRTRTCDPLITKERVSTPKQLKKHAENIFRQSVDSGGLVVPGEGIEPPFDDYKSTVLPLN